MRQDKGVNGDAQRLEQLGWMLFLKIFDAKDEDLEDMDETGEYVSPVPEKYQWRNWAADDEGITGDELINFIDRQLFPDLANLKSTDKRAQLIRDVFGGNNNYMKSGQLFRQVVNELNKIDFHASKDLQVFGNVYETLLKELQSAGSSGEFYTPRAVVEFMAEITDPKLGEKVLDPACGTGGFLTAAIEHIRKAGVENIEQRKQLQNTVHGMELKPLPHMLAVTNLILHDIEVPDISYEDSLLRNQSIKPNSRVDVILANPPFGGNVDDATASTFPVGFRTKESADLFLVMMVNYLKQGGRAAIVLPDGSLTGDGIKARIREMLLRNCNLHTIIRLPNSVFKPYASVATNLLFFEKVSSPAEELEDFATKEIWYYEHQLPEGSKGYSMTKPIRLEEFDKEKEWWKNREESEVSWKINLSEVIEKAVQNAKPHYEKEKELKREAYSLKEKLTQLKRKDKFNGEIAKLEKKLQETEANARAAKQTADNIYYGAFDLNYKNPNRVEEDLGNPELMLEKQDNVLGKISETINNIKITLKPAIENKQFSLFNEKFERFTNSKSNISNLRQFILQMAVQGKLTAKWREENLYVEPVTDLYEKIKIENEEIKSKYNLRNQKTLLEISKDEKLFQTPDSWAWFRLGKLLYTTSGGTPTRGNTDYWDGNIPWLKSGELTDGLITMEAEEKITELGHKKSSTNLFPKDTLLIALYGATAGKLGILTYPSTTNQAICGFYANSNIETDYLFYYLWAFRSKILSDSWGQAQPNISQDYLKKFCFALPPHEEQKAIVSKVKQLMAWCDELEKKIEKRDAYQEKMMQAVVKQAFKTEKETVELQQ
jgi:type I restriction enzyme M protein